MLSVAALLSGCGDDDDDDDDNGGPPAPQFAPGTTAAFTANTYNITLADGTPAQLTFPSAGTYALTANGQTETGNITGLTRNGEDYIATLTPGNNTGRIRAGEMRAQFTQRTANSFTGTLTVQEEAGARTYPFNATVNQPPIVNPPQTNNPPATNNPPQTNTPPAQTEAPASLAGRSLQLSYQPTGGERFDFATETSGTFEGTDPVTYTWDRTNTRIQATRNSPQGGAVVATYDIDLTFNQGSANAGTASVTYTQPGSSPRTDPATFTLTP